jgi:hypothetical protein
VTIWESGWKVTSKKIETFEELVEELVAIHEHEGRFLQERGLTWNPGVEGRRLWMQQVDRVNRDCIRERRSGRIELRYLGIVASLPPSDPP